MREIKFKLAWYKKIYQVVNIQWYKNGQVNRVKVIGKEREITNWLYPNDKNIVLLQYTGLKDKNGVEIYEGDIIQGFVLFGGQTPFVAEIERFLVIHEHGAFCIKSERSTFIFPHLFNEFSEIIGSIYENPALLEQAK
jgi:uncharacterized phage protein (TIGR01671 family)